MLAPVSPITAPAESKSGSMVVLRYCFLPPKVTCISSRAPTPVSSTRRRTSVMRAASSGSKILARRLSQLFAFRKRKLRIVHPGVAQIPVLVEHRNRRMLECHPEPFLALPQGLLRALALGDVLAIPTLGAIDPPLSLQENLPVSSIDFDAAVSHDNPDIRTVEARPFRASLKGRIHLSSSSLMTVSQTWTPGFNTSAVEVPNMPCVCSDQVTPTARNARFADAHFCHRLGPDQARTFCLQLLTISPLPFELVRRAFPPPAFAP